MKQQRQKKAKNMKFYYTYLYPRLQSNAGCLSILDGQFCLG
jgi:hypothetical protein